MTHQNKYHLAIPGLENFMQNLPEIFREQGTTIKNHRNEIKIIEHQNYNLCVKAFNKVTVFNRYMYSWFRATKAKRSYETAEILIRKGINTPEPVGYYEETGKWGIMRKSYYVSFCQEYDWLLADVFEKEIPEEKNILTDFAGFLATKLHPEGIWHNDLSSGNVLINRNPDNSYSFSIIDLNRIKFRKHISHARGIRNLKRLTSDPIQLAYLAKQYATSCHENESIYILRLISSNLLLFSYRRHSKRILHSLKPRRKTSKERIEIPAVSTLKNPRYEKAHVEKTEFDTVDL